MRTGNRIGLILLAAVTLLSTIAAAPPAQAAAQVWQTSELNSDVIGARGTLYRFNVKTEVAIGYDAGQFGAEALAVLGDQRSWAGIGEARFQLMAGGAQTGDQSDAGVEFTIYLATPATVDRLCAPLRTLGKLSCRNGDRVVANIDRWMEGPAIYHDSFEGELATYRNYLINHEVGHRIGKSHQNVNNCRADLYAPVMMQQTFDVRGCVINGWPAYDLLTVGEEPRLDPPPTGPCDSAVVFPWSADDRPLDDSVARLYRAAFGRSPDQTGLAYWISQRATGLTMETQAGLFLASEEGRLRYEAAENDQFVEALYANVFERASDAEGKTFWLSVLASGSSRADVLLSFSDSAENITRTNTSQPQTAGQGWVARLYRAVFGRAPDCEGARYWLWAPYSQRQIVEVFIGGVEFQARYGNTTDARFVGELYRNVLGRQADAAGLEYWTEQLSRPNFDRSDLVLEWLDSAEFRVRTGTN